MGLSLLFKAAQTYIHILHHRYHGDKEERTMQQKQKRKGCLYSSHHTGQSVETPPSYHRLSGIVHGFSFPRWTLFRVRRFFPPEHYGQASNGSFVCFSFSFWPSSTIDHPADWRFFLDAQPVTTGCKHIVGRLLHHSFSPHTVLVFCSSELA